MIRKIHGRVHGKSIELDEDPGVADGQEVEVQIKLISPSPPQIPMSDGLAKVYEILGRRHSSGHTDTAARHNEHQP